MASFDDAILRNLRLVVAENELKADGSRFRVAEDVLYKSSSASCYSGGKFTF